MQHQPDHILLIIFPAFPQEETKSLKHKNIPPLLSFQSLLGIKIPQQTEIVPEKGHNNKGSDIPLNFRAAQFTAVYAKM